MVKLDGEVSLMAITTARASFEGLGILNISNSGSLGGMVEYRRMPLGGERSFRNESIFNRFSGTLKVSNPHQTENNIFQRC